MSRYSQSHDDNLTFVIIILIGGVAWQHRTQLVQIVCIALAIMVVLILLTYCTRLIRLRMARPLDFDNMTGLEFERSVAILLKQNGFRKITLTERYDFGVDIIAHKEGVRWGIQAKRHSGIVKANAVRQVVTGLRVYGCDRAMVITNSTYSSTAKRLAQANDCVLVDRSGLKRLTRQR